MRLGLRFLRAAATPSDEAVVASPDSLSTLSTSTSLDDFLHPLSVKELQWEQQELKEELYQSIFHAFRQHNNLPPEEADQPLTVPASTIADGFAKPTVPEKDVSHSEEHLSSAVISLENLPHAPEGLLGGPMEDSTSIEEGSSTVQTRASKRRRDRLRRKSAKIFNSVKTAFHLPSFSKLNQSLMIIDPESQPIEGLLDFTFNDNEISSTDAVCGTDDELSDDTANSVAKPSLPEEHPRKASDNTILSEGSKTSSATVYKRPSRHVSFSIENSETDNSTHHVRPSSYDPSRIPASLDADKFELLSYCHELRPNSDNTSQGNSHGFGGDTQVFESTGYVPPAVSSLPEYSLPQRLFSDSDLQTRQEKALHDFNVLAKEYDIYTLINPEHDPINYQCFIRPKTSKTEYFLRKVRSMRSYLHFKTPERDAPALRRVKTLTALSEKYYAMDSLKGKHLEKLGRFGGYGNLTLPGDFAPAVMRLPAFLASLIDYLQIHGPKSRNIFFEAGDLAVASSIYNHYADQILSMEKDSDLTDLTARRSEFSSKEVEEYHFEDDFLRGRFHVLPVAWTFKNILMGIPGGILGAPRLYPTLVDITYRVFPDEPAVPQGGYNGALPTLSPTRARVISLAILALTNNMQFDFICAVFGLCSLLDYETHKLLDFYKTKNIPRINQATLLSRDRIVEVFAPLLAEETKDVGSEDRGCDAYIVMEMMLDYWRTVSHELRTSDI